MLPVIMAAAEREPVLGPDDLGAHFKAGGLQRLLHLTRMKARVPDIGDRAGK